MKKLTILLDMDDVLWPLLNHWVNTLNIIYKTNVNADNIIEWDISRFFPSLTKSQIFSPTNSDTFWNYLSPIKDGPNVVASLQNNGHKIKVVTATDYRNTKPKIERFLQCYPMLSFSDIIITSGKQSIKGDILVDDAIHNLIGGEYQKILITAPHNKNIDIDGMGITRVNNLSEAYEAINLISWMG